MEKIKSRWRKNYLQGDDINKDEAKDDNSDTGGYNNKLNSNHNNITNNSIDHHNHNHNNINSNSNNIKNNNTSNDHNRHHHSSSKHSTPPTYEPLTENLYLDKRKNEHSRSRKDARSMVCDCILTKEERARGIMGCLDDCLNRMLMIECGPKCTLGDHCLNKRFQKSQSAKVEVFKTRKKGWGLRAITELPANSFIMEYVGEVVRSKEFRSRVKKYTKQKIKHHYFMALRSDEIIDATVKGNFTRFINHSCEPNCETQKWTVNGDLRIGFFTIKDLQPGDEITFDYQFQRYGRKAQKCYCEAPSCRGYIGGNEQTFSLNGHSSPQLNENKSHKKSYKHGVLVDITLEDKINTLAEDAASGLKTKDQVIALASLSIKAEELSDRKKLLDIIRTTKSEISLRLFVDYHGLEILCLWMRDPQADCEFKATIIEILEKLPIPNKTKVLESNVYRMIERWATEEQKSVQPTIQPETNNDNSSNFEFLETPSKRRKLDDENDTNDNESLDHEENDTNKSQESNKSGVDTLKENSDSISQPNSQTNQQRQQPPISPTKDPNNTSLPLQSINSPNIKALASKLLKKFQALSPGFKIPRLNRLQRMEIEKKMDEEVISDDAANHDKLVFDQKNPFASRNYFKSTTNKSISTATNGLVNNSTNKTDSILPIRRRFDSLANNIDLTPAPKISKEEHRQQFEMHVRLKDYYDTIEKHYGTAAVEQIKSSILPIRQRFDSLTANNVDLTSALKISEDEHRQQFEMHVRLKEYYDTIEKHYGSAAVEQIKLSQGRTAYAPPPAPIYGLPQHLHQAPPYPHIQQPPPPPQPPPTPGQNHLSFLTTTIANHHLAPSLATPAPLIAPQSAGAASALASLAAVATAATPLPTPQTIPPIVSATTSAASMNDNNMELMETTINTRPDPTILPTIKVLANNLIEPAHLIDDELAFSICGYDEYYTLRDKEITVDDVNDDSYPCPGSYYTTPNGETWFATVTIDRKTQQPQTVILNLQIRSDPDKSLTTSPYKQQPYVTSTDTNTESPTTNSNSGDKMPGKMKKKIFEHGVSKFIKDALSVYYKPDCKVARITSKEDFVFLARKLTLAVLEKELDRKGDCEKLECNKQVKKKVEDFVKIYMAKFGKLYVR